MTPLYFALAAGAESVADLAELQPGGEATAIAESLVDIIGGARSRSLAALRESGLTDTHARLHWRPIGTWSSNWVPYVARIDYVLVSDDVPVLGSWTVQLPGSDHRAVIADLGRPD